MHKYPQIFDNYFTGTNSTPRDTFAKQTRRHTHTFILSQLSGVSVNCFLYRRARKMGVVLKREVIPGRKNARAEFIPGSCYLNLVLSDNLR